MTDARPSTAPLTDSFDNERWIDLGLDPRAADLLAGSLANELSELRVDAVAAWSGDEDVVLAQLVAARIGVPRVVLYEDLGLLKVSRTLPAGSRVALVYTAVAATRSVEMATGLLESSSYEVVSVLAVEPGVP